MNSFISHPKILLVIMVKIQINNFDYSLYLNCHKCKYLSPCSLLLIDTKIPIPFIQRNVFFFQNSFGLMPKHKIFSRSLISAFDELFFLFHLYLNLNSTRKRNELILVLLDLQNNHCTHHPK